MVSPAAGWVYRLVHAANPVRFKRRIRASACRIILDYVDSSTHPGWPLLPDACRGDSAFAGSCCCCCPSPWPCSLYCARCFPCIFSLSLPYIFCRSPANPLSPFLPPVPYCQRTDARSNNKQINHVTWTLSTMDAII